MPQVHLIPEPEFAPGEAAAIRNETIRKLVQKISAELRIAPEKVVIRDILPEVDLDYASESWSEVTGTTRDAYETMTTGTMGDNKWVCIYGVNDFSPGSVSAIRFNVGGSNRVIWNLENLYSSNGDGPRVGLSPSGVLIPQNAPYTISRYVEEASQATHIVLRGIVGEAVGKTITP